MLPHNRSSRGEKALILSSLSHVLRDAFGIRVTSIRKSTFQNEMFFLECLM